MIDVPDIELELFGPGEGVASMALGPPADAGTDFVPTGLLVIIQRKVFYQQGSRTDQGHIAFQDVDELGEFVDAGGADELADCSQSLGIRQQPSIGIPLVGHALEFDHFEDLTVEAGTLLQEEGTGSFVGKMEP